MSTLPLKASVADAIAYYSNKYSVSDAIHAEDHIFNFLMTHPVFASDADRVEYYFRDGANSARLIRELLQRHLPLTSPIEMLEFASGYGCVSRHLLKEPSLHVASCDIHSEAISFLTEKIGVGSLQSASVPEELRLPQAYDAVFALSFFSHMPITTWSRWLTRLTQAVRAGGVIIFTTQGIASSQYFGWPAIPSSGFWFQASSEQRDLSTEEYGQTIVTTQFVRAAIADIAEVNLIALSEGMWWGHQDLYVLRRL